VGGNPLPAAVPGASKAFSEANLSLQGMATPRRYRKALLPSLVG